MTDFQHIGDAEDPRIADYVDLRDPDVRRGLEHTGGFFIAESPHVIATVVRSGRRVRSVLVSPKQQVALAELLTPLDAPVYVAPESVLRRIVGFNLHRGAVAAVERWPLPDPASLLRGTELVVAVERVNDHENLGVLFRNAAAFDLDAVVLDSETADPLYRRCVRVSIGHVCTVPWTRYETPADISATGLALVALTPAVDAQPIDEVVWPARAAIMLGAEGPGLSDATLAAADLRVRIPTRPDVDSLNVATAAAIAFYASSRSWAR